MSTSIAGKSYERPIFVLEFTIFGTGADIRLNDIPALHHAAAGKTKSEKPVPEYIIDGTNTLSVKSFPIKEDNDVYREGAYIDVSLSVRERDDTPSSNQPVLHLRLNPTNGKDALFVGSSEDKGETPNIISRTESEITAQRAISIDSPYPRWAWQDGKTIENTKENYEGLLTYLKEIWQALNSGDLNTVNMHYDPAAEEFSKAYHHDDKKHGHRIMNTGGLIGDPDWILGDINKLLSKRTYELFIYANSKLAVIRDTTHKKTPIMYVQPSTRLISFQKFGFYKNKNNEWVMIR